MICSVLPCNADLLAAASSRMSWSLSLADSPAAQRLLQRVIEAGMGLFARHVPLANSKKSLQGSVLRSRSVISMPWRELVCGNISDGDNRRNASESHGLRSGIVPLSNSP